MVSNTQLRIMHDQTTLQTCNLHVIDLSGISKSKDVVATSNDKTPLNDKNNITKRREQYA